MLEADFTGKVVLVVGGTSGIGNGIAQGFRARGGEVHVWGTRKSAAHYRAEEGSNLAGLLYSRMDVSDFDALQAFNAAFDRLDVLVLCQGLARYGRAEFTMAGFRQVVDINLNSLMACALKYHDLLRESRGSVVTISSGGAFHAMVGNPAYGASKAAAVSLTQSLAVAWARDGIRVNGVAPGLVATKMTKVTTDNPERLEARLKGIPAGRLGTPDDIANAVIFLASPSASYVYGQTLLVDGGNNLA